MSKDLCMRITLSEEGAVAVQALFEASGLKVFAEDVRKQRFNHEVNQVLMDLYRDTSDDPTPEDVALFIKRVEGAMKPFLEHFTPCHKCKSGVIVSRFSDDEFWSEYSDCGMRNIDEIDFEICKCVIPGASYA